MICKIQVLVIDGDGREETRELACLERTDLKPETLGLTLAEGKTVLKGLQQIVVERQVSSSLLAKRACPDCGQRRSSKGNHTLSVRTVFGQLTVRSPRLHHCTCRPHHTKTFSPLAELLPERISPELLFLETKWASLMSYGMTSKLLHDVLPIDEPVNTFTIRQNVADVAERLERELGEEQCCFIEGCQRDWDRLPPPDGPLTVGIDGGFIRAPRKEGHFEVIAGKKQERTERKKPSGQTIQTALAANPALGWALITHPFHPLSGQRFPILGVFEVRSSRAGSASTVTVFAKAATPIRRWAKWKPDGRKDAATRWTATSSLSSTRNRPVRTRMPGGVGPVADT